MTVNPPRPPMDPEVLAELLPLTQVIADTVHSTHLTLGPGGDEDLICALTVTVAAWAGQYILPSRARELVGQTSAAVPGPPATRAADPDRIAEALYAHNHPGWATRYTDLDQDERDTYLARADAVLAVLPPPVDRAAVLREAADAPAAECSAQHHRFDDGRLCIRAAQHRGDHIDERGYHWSDTVAIYPLADGTVRTGVNLRAELRRMADEAQQRDTEAPADPKCVCGHPVRLHHEDVCLTADCDCVDCLEPEGPLPDRLEAVLTRRFTELGNPFSRMSINFQGPDGWPASKEVGPHDVAEVLRELLADEASGARRAADEKQPDSDREPKPGDRVRVTYEGTWLADDDPRMVLVGNHSGDVWRNVAPDHARVEVLPADEADAS